MFIMGGGGSKAKTKSEVYNESVASAVVRNIQQCLQSASAIQSLEITGDGNVVDGLKMKQAVLINTTCMKETVNDINLANDITAALKASAQSQGSSFFGGSSSANVDSAVKNIVKSSLTLEDIQKCAQDTNAKQMIVLKGSNNVLRDVSMEQTMQVFRECLMNTVNRSNLLNKIFTQQDLNADSQAGSMLPSLLPDWNINWSYVLLFVLACLIGYFVYTKYYAKKNAVNYL